MGAESSIHPKGGFIQLQNPCLAELEWLKFYFFLAGLEKCPIKHSSVCTQMEPGEEEPLHYIQVVFRTQKDVNDYFSWTLQKPLEKH